MGEARGLGQFRSLVVSKDQSIRAVGIGGKNDASAHGMPLPEEKQRRIRCSAVPAGDTAGVDLQQGGVGINCVKGLQGGTAVPGSILIKEAVSGVELGDEVEMP